MKKNNTGITLVALVITIIVLIILAGVSINSVMNGGLIDNAKVAKDEFSKAADSETKDIDSLTLKTDMLVAEANSGNAGGTSESTLVASSGMLTGIERGIKVSELESMLPEGYSVLKADGSGFSAETNAEGKTEKERTIIGTGMQIVKNGNIVSRTVIYGDVDKNGTIDSTDAALVAQACAGIRELEDHQKVAADIDCNGLINLEDANLMKLMFTQNQKIAAQDANKIVIEKVEGYYARIIDESGIGSKIIKKEWCTETEDEVEHYNVYVAAGTTVTNITPTNINYSIRVTREGEGKIEGDKAIATGDILRLTKKATVNGENVSYGYEGIIYFIVNASE